jgi:hypothetical protein
MARGRPARAAGKSTRGSPFVVGRVYGGIAEAWTGAGRAGAGFIHVEGKGLEGWDAVVHPQPEELS